MVDLSKRRFFTRTPKTTPLLPWLAEPDSFVDSCTRCNRCLPVCETQIIIQGDGGYPTVDFNLGECTFCYQCAAACPEPLFLAQTDSPWSIKAQINLSCLTQQNVECRSCADACEPEAIRFQLAIGKVAQPKVGLDDCTGCGACVAICPTKAINLSAI